MKADEALKRLKSHVKWECPLCKNKNIHYNKHRKCYHCYRCDSDFDLDEMPRRED